MAPSISLNPLSALVTPVDYLEYLSRLLSRFLRDSPINQAPEWTLDEYLTRHLYSLWLTQFHETDRSEFTWMFSTSVASGYECVECKKLSLRSVTAGPLQTVLSIDVPSTGGTIELVKIINSLQLRIGVVSEVCTSGICNSETSTKIQCPAILAGTAQPAAANRASHTGKPLRVSTWSLGTQLLSQWAL
jgi:hypothetical protein